MMTGRKNYVNGHEQPDVVLSCWVFVKKYLRRELIMHILIQVSEEELFELDIKFETSYIYINDNAKIMYEFHVDANRQFTEMKEFSSIQNFDKERKWKNLRRSREYMVAYFIISLEQNGEEGKIEFDLNEMKPCAVPASKIEQMKQKVRTHRSAFDFDTSLCKVIINHVHVEVECDTKNRKTMKIEKKVGSMNG